MNEIECPTCKIEFKVEEWSMGECPTCGREYWWDEMCTEDYSDCWSYIDWGPENDKKNSKINDINTN